MPAAVACGCVCVCVMCGCMSTKCAIPMNPVKLNIIQNHMIILDSMLLCMLTTLNCMFLSIFL